MGKTERSVLITVKLLGSLRRLSPADTPGIWKGEVAVGTTIEELLSIIGTTPKEITAAVIQGKRVDLTMPITEEVEIYLAPPFGGG